MADRAVGDVRQVLVERATAGDVERLGTAADAEDRDPAAVGLARQRDLERVEGRLGRPEHRVTAGAVGARVEIGPAGEQQAGEVAQQRRDRRSAQRREHDRDPAGPLDRLEVLQAERHLRLTRLALGAQGDVLRSAQL